MGQQVKIINFLDGENGVTEKIKKAMYEAAKQFVYIGFLLWEVKEYQYYVTSGYKDVYEYAEKELNFKKSSTKNFIAVATEFGNKYYNSPITSCSYLPTMNLKPEYKDFKYSQLVEMLAMSEPQRKKIKPEMTVKQIREIKKQPEAPEFGLEPNWETTPLPLPDINPENQNQITKNGQTSGRKLEYTITMDRADWEIIITNLEDDIKYNYDDPGTQKAMQRIIDEIKGIIN